MRLCVLICYFVTICGQPSGSEAESFCNHCWRLDIYIYVSMERVGLGSLPYLLLLLSGLEELLGALPFLERNFVDWVSE